MQDHNEISTNDNPQVGSELEDSAKNLNTLDQPGNAMGGPSTSNAMGGPSTSNAMGGPSTSNATEENAGDLYSENDLGDIGDHLNNFNQSGLDYLKVLDDLLIDLDTLNQSGNSMGEPSISSEVQEAFNVIHRAILAELYVSQQIMIENIKYTITEIEENIAQFTIQDDSNVLQDRATMISSIIKGKSIQSLVQKISYFICNEIERILCSNSQNIPFVLERKSVSKDISNNLYHAMQRIIGISVNQVCSRGCIDVSKIRVGEAANIVESVINCIISSIIGPNLQPYIMKFKDKAFNLSEKAMIASLMVNEHEIDVLRGVAQIHESGVISLMITDETGVLREKRVYEHDEIVRNSMFRKNEDIKRRMENIFFNLEHYFAHMQRAIRVSMVILNRISKIRISNSDRQDTTIANIPQMIFDRLHAFHAEQTSDLSQINAIRLEYGAIYSRVYAVNQLWNMVIMRNANYLPASDPRQDTSWRKVNIDTYWEIVAQNHAMMLTSQAMSEENSKLLNTSEQSTSEQSTSEQSTSEQSTSEQSTSEQSIQERYQQNAKDIHTCNFILATKARSYENETQKLLVQNELSTPQNLYNMCIKHDEGDIRVGMIMYKSLSALSRAKHLTQKMFDSVLSNLDHLITVAKGGFITEEIMVFLKPFLEASSDMVPVVTESLRLLLVNDLLDIKSLTDRLEDLLEDEEEGRMTFYKYMYYIQYLHQVRLLTEENLSICDEHICDVFNAISFLQSKDLFERDNVNRILQSCDQECHYSVNVVMERLEATGILNQDIFDFITSNDGIVADNISLFLDHIKDGTNKSFENFLQERPTDLFRSALFVVPQEEFYLILDKIPAADLTPDILQTLSEIAERFAHMVATQHLSIAEVVCTSTEDINNENIRKIRLLRRGLREQLTEYIQSVTTPPTSQNNVFQTYNVSVHSYKNTDEILKEYKEEKFLSQDQNNNAENKKSSLLQNFIDIFNNPNEVESSQYVDDFIKGSLPRLTNKDFTNRSGNLFYFKGKYPFIDIDEGSVLNLCQKMSRFTAEDIIKVFKSEDGKEILKAVMAYPLPRHVIENDSDFTNQTKAVLELLEKASEPYPKQVINLIISHLDYINVENFKITIHLVLKILHSNVDNKEVRGAMNDLLERCSELYYTKKGKCPVIDNSIKSLFQEKTSNKIHDKKVRIFRANDEHRVILALLFLELLDPKYKIGKDNFYIFLRKILASYPKNCPCTDQELSHIGYIITLMNMKIRTQFFEGCLPNSIDAYHAGLKYDEHVKRVNFKEFNSAGRLKNFLDSHSKSLQEKGVAVYRKQGSKLLNLKPSGLFMMLISGFEYIPSQHYSADKQQSKSQITRDLYEIRGGRKGVGHSSNTQDNKSIPKSIPCASSSVTTNMENLIRNNYCLDFTIPEDQRPAIQKFFDNNLNNIQRFFPVNTLTELIILFQQLDYEYHSEEAGILDKLIFLRKLKGDLQNYNPTSAESAESADRYRKYVESEIRRHENKIKAKVDEIRSRYYREIAEEAFNYVNQNIVPEARKKQNRRLTSVPSYDINQMIEYVPLKQLISSVDRHANAISNSTLEDTLRAQAVNEIDENNVHITQNKTSEQQQKKRTRDDTLRKIKEKIKDGVIRETRITVTTRACEVVTQADKDIDRRRYENEQEAKRKQDKQIAAQDEAETKARLQDIERESEQRRTKQQIAGTALLSSIAAADSSLASSTSGENKMSAIASTSGENKMSNKIGMIKVNREMQPLQAHANQMPMIVHDQLSTVRIDARNRYEIHRNTHQQEPISEEVQQHISSISRIMTMENIRVLSSTLRLQTSIGPSTYIEATSSTAGTQSNRNRH